MTIKIKEIEATEKEMKKYFHAESHCDNTTQIILAYSEEGLLISKAFISKPTEERFKELLFEYGSSLREWSEADNNCEYQQWLEQTLQLKNIVYLDYIESLIENMGGATKIYEYLTQKYECIWLYSLIESEDFWDGKIGLFNYGEYVYSNINTTNKIK